MDTTLKHNHHARLDKLGIAAASVCAAHCFLTPLLIGVLPMVGLARLADERTEWVFVTCSVTLGILSLTAGYWRHHHRPAPLCVFTIGVSLILFARLFFEDNQRVEIPAVVAGALFLAVGHALNSHLYQTCATCQGKTSTAN